MDFESILPQFLSGGMAALFAGLITLLAWQLRTLSEGQKQLHRQMASLDAKIDATRQELSAEIKERHEATHARMDEQHRQLRAEIGEVRQELGARIDATHARMDEHHRQNQSQYQKLAAAFKHLDGKVEAMTHFLKALLAGEVLPEIVARRQDAGKAA